MYIAGIFGIVVVGFILSAWFGIRAKNKRQNQSNQ